MNGSTLEIRPRVPVAIFSKPFPCKRESMIRKNFSGDRPPLTTCGGMFEICPLFSNLPAFLLLAIFLSACAQAPVGNRITPSWDARMDELIRMETWDLKGRIAVRTSDESGSGSLHWTQRRDEYDLRVIAPFSGGVYELSGADGAVSLRTPDNGLLQAGNAESLLYQAAGWRFPVSELVFWIRGLPAPSLQVDRLLLDDENRVSELSQGGWSIHYKRYTGVGGVSMPARLDLENGQVRVRLSVQEWNLR